MASQQILEQGSVAGIPDYDLSETDVVQMAGGQVVQDDQRLAPLTEEARDMPADIAGPAGDQHAVCHDDGVA